MKPCGRQNGVWDVLNVFHHNFVSDPHVKTEKPQKARNLRFPALSRDDHECSEKLNGNCPNWVLSRQIYFNQN